MTPLVRLLLITWAALWVLGFLTALGGFGLGEHLGFSPAALLSGDPLAVLGIAAHPFLHDTHGLLHLLFNALLLYFFGPEVERMNPRGRFLRLLATAALVGVALRLVLYLLTGGFAGPAFGGSGLVACCFAFLAAVMPGLRVSLIVITVRLLPLFLVITGLDVLGLIAALAGQPSGIASELHLAGAAVGWTAAGGWQRFPIFAAWQQRRAQRRADQAREREAASEAELDRILAKISREGIGSLTPAERKFLDQRSRR